VAEHLAGAWHNGYLTHGLPCYEAWGFEDVGIFFDYASLYQKPRSPMQDASFKSALANMSIWYCNQLTTVFILRGQVILSDS
jgi:hypothetical protein